MTGKTIFIGSGTALMATFLAGTVADLHAWGSQSICEKTVHVVTKDSLHDQPAVIHWQNSAVQSMDWDSAVRYCDTLTQDGFADWRLPSLEEMAHTYQHMTGCTVVGIPNGLAHNAILIAPNYKPFQPHEYWVGSYNDSQLIHAWVIDFGRGRAYENNKTFWNLVRCVREE